MAEALVLLVVGKIGSALAQEAVQTLRSLLGKEISLLLEAEGSMKQIESEFEVMQAFLNEAEIQKGNNKTLEAWLEQVRKIAYEVEDITDEYAYFIGEQQIAFKGFFMKAFERSKNIRAWHKIASQLQQIQVRLQNLSNMKDRYSIDVIGESSNLNHSSERHRDMIRSLYSMNQDELVGVGEERKKLVEWLMGGELACSVSSIWGMGGLGKTTLVHDVYNSQIIKKEFDCLAWITVSQKYQVEDILIRIFREVSGKKEVIPADIDTMDHMKLVELLRGKLQQKRYLIILDDVWSREAWFDLSSAFLENKQRSRIVITTRNKDVASLATRGYSLELQKLKEREAWELFCRRAFFHEESKSCPQGLEQWGRMIMEKCQGLPLAIVSIGGLLSFREKEEAAWKKFYSQLNWELANNKELTWVSRVLNLSYNDLPSHLKNCFLYCSIFPEDYLILRKRLIRLWISEGFIQGRRFQTLEEVAEEYLQELIHRSMLQVVERNDFGRVKGCRMHDIVRELAVTTSAKENFCALWDNPESSSQFRNTSRRLSIHHLFNSSNLDIHLPHLRSFVMFSPSLASYSTISRVSSRSRYLRVLELEGIPIEKIPDSVMDLFNLQHLGLRSTKVKKLPKSIRRLQNLQTLDVYDTDIEQLPQGITKLIKLRHLFAEKFHDPRGTTFHSRSGVRAPNGMWNLRNLQTLQSVEASRSLVEKLGNFTQLRSLRIRKVRGLHCEQLCKSLAKMHFLSYLAIFANDENEVLDIKDLKPPPQLLLKLDLTGRLEKGLVESPSFHVLGNNLRELDLGWSGLQDDPLPFLSRMSNLAFLCLKMAYDGQQLLFRTGWFPKLKTLIFRDMARLKHLVMEEKTMERLQRMELVRLGDLKEVPQGIEFLQSLQELWLSEMQDEFIDKIRGPERGKIGGITSITIELKRGGKWIYERLQ